MIGAIAGDIIGSVYEHSPVRTKEFPLFHPACRFTDDTVMTVAVAEAAMTGGDYRSSCLAWGRRYPKAGYGRAFAKWLRASDPAPYGSRGNGSAMRVSPVGHLFDTPSDVLARAADSAAITHDHPDGIRGAQAVALAVFLARAGESRAVIRGRIAERFGYDLGRSVDEVRRGYAFESSCTGSVPEAIIAFLDSESWEDAVRNAVSLGGDSDTQACIAGAIAEAYYRGVPDGVRSRVLSMLPAEMQRVVGIFESFAPPSMGRGARNTQLYPDPDTLYDFALGQSLEYSLKNMRREWRRERRDEERRGASADADEKERRARLLVQYMMPSFAVETALSGLAAFGRLLEAVARELEDPAAADSARFGAGPDCPGIVGYLYLRKAAEILAREDANLGAYHEVAMSGGRLVLHTFCSATVRQWARRKKEYGEVFGPVPEWIMNRHPDKRIALLDLALDTGLALPDRQPACFAGGDRDARLRRPPCPDLAAVEEAALRAGCPKTDGAEGGVPEQDP
jgi:ADP-ribosylglycohydrolase